MNPLIDTHKNEQEVFFNHIINLKIYTHGINIYFRANPEKHGRGKERKAFFQSIWQCERRQKVSNGLSQTCSRVNLTLVWN